ncbi:MAG: peptidylprolyl isomerase, partial [Clostridia bacterium]|nr:peptidylprolyl isomerase [Clostridia bacterium]
MTHPVIEIRVKDFGTMTAELYPEKAPKTVANFVKLAEEGFFDGLIFHRIIKGFMIQGGGYNA